MSPNGVAAAVFLVSGASALVYQVAWQRILALGSGVSIYSITMIVGAFMAGLGVGSQLGGIWSARLSAARSLRVFALLEIGIGVFGALSPFVYYDVLYQRAAHLYGSPVLAGVLHFGALLPPTLLMGMSLPLLVRGVVRDQPTAGRTIGTLYGVNVLGAAVGALATPWLLIRFWGIRGALLLAAAGNLAAGLTVLLAQRRLQQRGVAAAPPAREAGAPGGEAAAPAPDAAREAHRALLEDAAGAPSHASPAGGGRRRPFVLWLALYALSGFCALALEILWFRVMDVAVKSMAFTFGTVLSIYLLGSAAGSLIGARRVTRLGDPLAAFLLAQCAILLYSGLVMGLVVWLPSDTPGLAWYFDYWRRYDGFKLGQDWDPATLARIYLLQPLVLYGPPTLLMGLSFPILQGAVHDDPRTSGRKVGVLQAANIAGCVLGSLLVGLLALSSIGTSETVRLLIGVGVLFALLGLVTSGGRAVSSDGGADGVRVTSSGRATSRVRAVFAVAGLLLAVLAACFPAQEAFWLRLHGREADDSFADEDTTGVGAMSRMPWTPSVWNLSFNGKGQGSLPFYEGHLVMGAVPALVHPLPQEIAIIGLGTGGTAWAAGCRRETRSLTVFELSGSQPRLLERMLAREPTPELRQLLQDPRLQLRIADGRHAIEHGEARYDLIEQDPIFPDRAFSGNLYSVEYFRNCARKLKPGGMLCSWAPTPRIFAAMAQAFPYLVGTPDRMVVLATNEPLAVDLAAWTARLDSPEVRAYLDARTRARILNRMRKLRPLAARGMWDVTPNRDLFPRDEFRTPE